MRKSSRPTAACITACPTDAIVSPTVVDSRRCIAYWTIENTDEHLPDFIQENQQDWGFGCDICQDVCPWNLKFSKVTEEPAFLPREVLAHPSRAYFEGLSEDDFAQAFENSPLRRTGLRRIQRNIML
jgi:epoxyqueuosine reductase